MALYDSFTQANGSGQEGSLTASDAPICPKCGSTMQRRTARRGRYAGKQFWGCSEYPACRGIVPCEHETLDDKPTFEPTVTAPAPRSFPVPAAAAPRDPNGQCVLMQACALPAPLVELIHLHDMDRAWVRAASQWRLDLPLPAHTDIPREERDLLAMAESVLTRGAAPFCSPTLEHALGELLIPRHASAALVDALETVVTTPTTRFQPLSFDSEPERIAFGWLRARIELNELSWSLIPQPELAGLSPAIDRPAAQRGDFLLVHPERAPILVEIDGAQHAEHPGRDASRDRALRQAGVTVVRVPVDEVRRLGGPSIDRVEALLSQGGSSSAPQSPLTRVIRISKFYHQVQLAVLAALRTGYLRLGELWRVGIVLPGLLREDSLARTVVPLAVGDLAKLLGRLASLYERDVALLEPRALLADEAHEPEGIDILVAPADGSADHVWADVRPRFLVADLCYPGEIQAPQLSIRPVQIGSPRRDDARWFLRYLFRKDDFWEGQWEAVERALRGLDSVVLLPTAGGKSIAFQLAALLRPGRCIVVDPTISLIDDQIDNLRSFGIDRCIGITSQLSAQERDRALQGLRSGHYLFSYVAPERFQTPSFRDALRALTTHTPVSLIAIDEAHCVSEWGHDFRTAYLNLGRISRDYGASQGIIPPLVALTGTASKIVLKDVQRELGITAFEAIITPRSFDRAELQFRIIPSLSSEKLYRVIGLLESLPGDFAVEKGRFFAAGNGGTYAGLLFCPHVNGTYGVVEQARSLRQEMRIPVEVYSGGAPRGWDDDRWAAEKHRIAHEFKRDGIPLLACTSAFGMGIDKGNIRYTIHIGLPRSIETFYQEAGRAGRDRGPAACAIILSNDDPVRSQRLLSPETSLEEIDRLVRAARWDDADDIIRALWFHTSAFRGEQAELDDVASMLHQLGDTTTRHYINVTWRDPRWATERGGFADARQRAEKALHRLVLLGVVADYSVDYASHEFGVQVAGVTQEAIARALGAYATAYQWRLGEQCLQSALALRRDSHNEYVLEVARLLIRFIYEHVEMARRRALNEMLQAAGRARDGDDLRRRIVDYLQQSEWDERLEAVRASPRGGLECLAPLLDDCVSPNDAAALRAAAGRALASYPDVPGLLLLRGLSEALCPDTDPEVVRQNVVAALGFAAQPFGLDENELARSLAQMITRAQDKVGAAELLLHAALPPDRANRSLARSLLRYLPHDLATWPARWLLQRLLMQCAALKLARKGSSNDGNERR